MASTSAVASLVGAAIAVVGSVADYGRAVTKVTMVVTPTGTVTGGQVELEGSQDNVNWVGMATATPAQGRSVAASASTAALRYWRARITADVTGGGTVRVTIMEAEYNGGIL